MDPCFQKNVCNCVSGCVCDDGYECCSEMPKNKKPRYGLCVKKGTCDKTRGICRSSSELPVNIKYQFPIDMNVESYRDSITSREGYDDNSDDPDNCKNWKQAMLVLVIFVFVLVLAIMYMKLK